MPTTEKPVAGRELDVEIGRRVFGHLFCDQPKWAEARCSMYGEQTHYASDGGSGRSDRGDLPEYSTDIAAAFLVVEEMHRRLRDADETGVTWPWPDSTYLELSCVGLFPPKGGWVASFCLIPDYDEWIEDPEKFGGAKADTAALAISLAALRAIEGAAR